MSRVKEIAHWLKELESPSKELSPWETQFIESVSDQFMRSGRLSDKQIDKLEKIYAEKTD